MKERLKQAYLLVSELLQLALNENPKDDRVVEYLTDAKDALDAAVDWIGI